MYFSRTPYSHAFEYNVAQATVAFDCAALAVGGSVLAFVGELVSFIRSPVKSLASLLYTSDEAD